MKISEIKFLEKVSSLDNALKPEIIRQLLLA
jgi:hypothetical protein